MIRKRRLDQLCLPKEKLEKTPFTGHIYNNPIYREIPNSILSKVPEILVFLLNTQKKLDDLGIFLNEDTMNLTSYFNGQNNTYYIDIYGDISDEEFALLMLDK